MINNMLKIFLLTIYALTFCLSAVAYNSNDHKIAVLVNDQLITSYDIIQRMKLNAILKGINITPENNKLLVNNVTEDLIKEKLTNEKIGEYKIIISDDEYIDYETSFFQSLPLKKNIIIELLQTNEINYSEFKKFLINQISWQKLVSGMYYRLTSTSEIEIEEIMNKNENITKDIARNIIIERQLDLKSSKMIRDMLDEATIEYK